METYLISKSDIEDCKLFTDAVDDKRVNPFIIEAQDLDLKPNLGYQLYFDLINNYGEENIFINYSSSTGSFTIGEIIQGKIGSTIVATGTLIGDISGKFEIQVLTGSFVTATSLYGMTSTFSATPGIISYNKYYLLINGDNYVDPLGYNVKYIGLKRALVYWAFARFIENQSISIASHSVVQKTSQYSQPASGKMIADRITQARSGAVQYFRDVEKYLYDKNYGVLTYPLWQVGSGIINKRRGGIVISSINKFERESDVYRHVNRNKYGDPYGGSFASGGNIRYINNGVPISCILNQYSYDVSELAGKTIVYVQIDNVPLISNQYSLVGSIFTITDTNVTIDNNSELKIAYQV